MALGSDWILAGSSGDRGSICRIHERDYTSSMVKEIVECQECCSLMVFKEDMWQCENCCSVLTGGGMHIDDVTIEEGLSMLDVIKQYEERDREG